MPLFARFLGATLTRDSRSTDEIKIRIRIVTSTMEKLVNSEELNKNEIPNKDETAQSNDTANSSTLLQELRKDS